MKERKKKKEKEKKKKGRKNKLDKNINNGEIWLKGIKCSLNYL